MLSKLLKFNSVALVSTLYLQYHNKFPSSCQAIEIPNINSNDIFKIKDASLLDTFIVI